MLKVVYKTKAYVAILDTDDGVVEKIDKNTLVSIIKTKNLNIEGVKQVRGRLNVVSPKYGLNPNLNILNGELLRCIPTRDNLVICLSDWCYKLGHKSLTEKVNCNKITLILDDNLEFAKGGIFEYDCGYRTPYVFDIRHLTNVEPIYAAFLNSNLNVNFLRKHIIDTPKRFNLYVFAMYISRFDSSAPIMLQDYSKTLIAISELSKMAKPEYGVAIYNIEFFRKKLKKEYVFRTKKFHKGDKNLQIIKSDEKVNYLTYRCASTLTNGFILISYIAIFGNDVHPAFKKCWKSDVAEIMNKNEINIGVGQAECGVGLVNSPALPIPEDAKRFIRLKALTLKVKDGVLYSFKIEDETASFRLVLSQYCKQIDDDAFSSNFSLTNLNIVFVFDDSLQFSPRLFKGGLCNTFRFDISNLSDDKIVSGIYNSYTILPYSIIDKTDRHRKFFKSYLISGSLRNIQKIRGRDVVLRWFSDEDKEYYKNLSYNAMIEAVSFIRDYLNKVFSNDSIDKVYDTISELTNIFSNPDTPYFKAYNFLGDLVPSTINDISSDKWHICVNYHFLFSDLY